MQQFSFLKYTNNTLAVNVVFDSIVLGTAQALAVPT